MVFTSFSTLIFPEKSIELDNIRRMEPIYEKRRQLIKKIPKFWPIALFRHSSLEADLDKKEDQEALKYLEDIWIIRNPIEPRVYAIEFVRLSASLLFLNSTGMCLFRPLAVTPSFPTGCSKRNLHLLSRRIAKLKRPIVMDLNCRCLTSTGKGTSNQRFVRDGSKSYHMVVNKLSELSN